ncbi:MAG: B12-binding domain-containing radical SAM protein [Desulfobacterota bacterium]|nr:B12-binding domain-containing radical SAM protein [Thermodesulfobacteriota bacterium]
MKIELISPAAEENAPVPNLALPILASLTPSDIEVSFTDDLLTPIDLERGVKPVDLVGITVLTKTAKRAYEIADAYRRRGIPVVLGGIHVSALPEEAREHADAVVIGEAEELWPRLIDDFRKKDLKPFYRQAQPVPPSMIPRPRRDILPRRGYFPLDVVQYSRGCPFRCEFCSVRRFFGEQYRFRPLEAVVEEIRSLPHRLVLFNDDNVLGHPSYSRELLQALVPLKKKWAGESSLAGLKEIGQIELLAESGCIGLLIGFESLSPSNLRLSKKFQNDPESYREIIDALHRHGITVWGSFMFGFDDDLPETIHEAVSFAIQTKLFAVNFAILTPYPETDFYHRVKREGRLTHDRWWLLKNPNEVAPFYEPKRMSREALRRLWKEAWQEFYSHRSILRRFQWDYPPTLANRLVYFPFQWMHRRFIRKKILEGRPRYRRRLF